jgi:endoglucanase
MRVPVRFSLVVMLGALVLGGFSPAMWSSTSAGKADAAGSMTGLHVVGNQLENGQNQVVRLLGVNRSGSEYACIQGWADFDGPSDAASVQAMAAWHINAVRIPLNEDCWLGINGASPQHSGTNYQQAIASYVSLLNQNGMAAILDLHWTSPGAIQAKAQAPMPDADHAPAFWQSVANTFKGNSSVIFDLYNEPYPDNNSDTTAAWTCLKNGGTCPGVLYKAAGTQQLVTTIRGTGATNVIMVPGVQYTNSLSQWLSYKPSDPQNNLAASWHSYAGEVCSSTTCFNSQIAPVLQRVPLVTGEIGERDCAHSYIDSLMSWLDSHGGSYLAWAWNTYDCGSFPSLISDYNGTPTNYGMGYQAHLAALANTPPPSPGPTVTPGALHVRVRVGRSSVKAGQQQTVTVKTAPHASVTITISFPIGRKLRHSGTSSASGKVSWKFIEPTGVTKGKNHTVTVAVKVRDAAGRTASATTHFSA